MNASRATDNKMKTREKKIEKILSNILYSHIKRDDAPISSITHLEESIDELLELCPNFKSYDKEVNTLLSDSLARKESSSYQKLKSAETHIFRLLLSVYSEWFEKDLPNLEFPEELDEAVATLDNMIAGMVRLDSNQSQVDLYKLFAGSVINIEKYSIEDNEEDEIRARVLLDISTKDDIYQLFKSCL